MNRLQILSTLSFSVLMIGCANKKNISHDIMLHSYTIHSNNNYLLVGSGGAVLIDSGYEADAEKLLKKIEKDGIELSQIKAVVITHGHADHAGGAQIIRQKTGAQIIAGQGDQGMLQSGKNEKLCSTDFLAKRMEKKYQNEVFTPYNADILVEDEHDLLGILGNSVATTSLPSTPVTIKLLSGHTEGSLVIFAGDSVFAGDLLRGSLIGSGASTHFYMCDIEDNQKDIEGLLSAHPEAQDFYLGHLGPTDRKALEKEFGK